jgi:cation transport ATPase
LCFRLRVPRGRLQNEGGMDKVNVTLSVMLRVIRYSENSVYVFLIVNYYIDHNGSTLSSRQQSRNMFYQVVHSTLGRCRIRVPRLADDLEFAENLNRLVESLQFVTEVRINPAASSLIVNYKVSVVNFEDAQKHLSTCIEKASCIQQGNLIETSDEEILEESDLIPEVNQWRDLGLPLLSLSLAIFAVPLELPPLLIIIAIAGAAMPWFNRAADSIVNQHHPNIDLLDSAWMTLQVVQGQYIAPALKTSLVEIRRSLRGTVVESREQKALDFLNYLNQEIWVQRDQLQPAVRVRELQVGDRITIYAGEIIPVDGRILYGNGLVDCSYLTGIDTPVHCFIGQDVYASSQLIEGELSVLVERTGNYTRLGLIAHLMQTAPVHDTHIGVQQAEFVKNAIVPTLVLGGTIFAATGNIGAAISPFQFDFGSGIPISISTTILSALTYAVQNGVYIRSGRVVELLTQLNALVIHDSALSYLNTTASDCIGAIAILQKQGINVYLVSDDSLAETTMLAEKFGIHPDHILAKSHPQQQANLVHGLQSQGRCVAVLGVRGNCNADISISLAFTGNICAETADLVLLDQQLHGLIYAIAIAKRTMEVVYQNTATIVVPNLMMQIGGGMFLGVNPAWNVIVNNSSAFIAEFLNGSRPIFDSIVPLQQKNNHQTNIIGIPATSTELHFPVLNGRKLNQ